METVKYLVENGVDVNAKGKFNHTALMLASEYSSSSSSNVRCPGHLKIVKFLVKNGVNVKDV